MRCGKQRRSQQLPRLMAQQGLRCCWQPSPNIIRSVTFLARRGGGSSSSRRARSRRVLLSSSRGICSEPGGAVAVRDHGNFSVIQYPILDDNYSWVVLDKHSNEAAAIDPADASRAQAVASTHGCQLTTVLCTHKHWDHAGGNATLAAALPGLRVVGSHYEECPAVTETVQDQGRFSLFSTGSVTADVLHTPCHTSGHIAFVLSADQGYASALFCGDTLFVGGCGRFFEGSAGDMYNSLCKLSRLPPDTVVYCGHEYSASNMKFAMTVEPDNRALQAKSAWVAAQREAGLPTVPTTIGDELAYNPFMRVDEEDVCSAMGMNSWGDGGAAAVATMRELRQRKDDF